MNDNRFQIRGSISVNFLFLFASFPLRFYNHSLMFSARFCALRGFVILNWGTFHFRIWYFNWKSKPTNICNWYHCLNCLYIPHSLITVIRSHICLSVCHRMGPGKYVPCTQFFVPLDPKHCSNNSAKMIHCLFMQNSLVCSDIVKKYKQNIVFLFHKKPFG